MGKENKIRITSRHSVVAPEVIAAENVQDSIPIQTVHDKMNLIESYPGEFSRMYSISEVNYTTLNEEEQDHVYRRWRAFLNSLDSNSEVQLSIFNRSIDMDAFCDAVLMKERGDGLDDLRREANQIMLDRVAEGKNGIRSDKYLTVAIHAENAQKAQELFRRIDKSINTSLQKIGSGAHVVSIEDRLDVLFELYNPGHSGELLTRTKVIDENGINRDVAAFSFKNLRSMGLRPNDALAPSSLTFFSDYVEIGDKYARVLKISKYPATLSDEFMTNITAMNFNIISTLNIKPISNDEAERMVGQTLTMIRGEKDKAVQRAKSGGGDENSISPALLDREKEALEMREDMRQHDERLFETTLTMVVFADSVALLKEYTDTLLSEAAQQGVTVTTMFGMQDDGFVTTLPLCYNRMKERRTFKSSSVAALIPFSVMDLNDVEGINYSMNAVTRNLILYDRSKAANANGFILGIPGSGKSFSAKWEMLFVRLRTDSDIIIIDPEGEYGALCEALHGTTIHVTPGGHDCINPMTIFVDRGGMDEGNPVLEKVDFILNLCGTIVKSAWGIDSVQEAILDESIHKLYEKFYVTEPDGRKSLRNITNDEMPTLTDLYEEIRHRPEPEARELTYALSLYVDDGSLSVFGGKTSVDMSNRFMVFDISALGDKLKKVAMQIIFDTIWQKIVANRQIGRQTWFFCDEIYLLFKDENSAKFLQALWKRARKYGGVPTGITQNVEDLLNSATARSMLSNSSFVEMLNQATSDRDRLIDLLHLSESQADYITDAPKGQGLIYTGAQTVPFFSRVPKNTKIYRYLTSDFNEIRRYREEELAKKLEEEKRLNEEVERNTSLPPADSGNDF